MSSTVPYAAPVRGRTFASTAEFQLAALILVHVLLWTWVGVVSRSNLDAPGDMVEAYVWGQGWQWGYYKHPPLSAWVVGLWFSVVPESHFGYALLASVNGAVGLLGLAVLAREFLPRHWILLVVAAASLTPGITTLAMRFNANAILVSTWPWAMALFARLMIRGRTSDAVACGVACALAMLGKYYSGVLLLTLVATALLLPDWRARLRSRAPWIAVAVFAACMAPHLLWLAVQTQGPLDYARAATLPQTRGEVIMRALNFALAQYAFPLLAFLTFWLSLGGVFRRQAWWRAATSLFRPRFEAVWLLAVAPIVATMIGTVLTGARTASVWGLPISAGLVLLAACRAREAGAELRLDRLGRTLAVIWTVVILMAPLWWLGRAALATPADAEPREELAQEVATQWRREHGGALPWVSGTRALAASVAFYSDDRPRYWSLWNSTIETPWVNTDEVMRRGAVVVCEAGDSACEQLAETWSADRRSVKVSKHTWSFQFAPREYAVYMVAPSAPRALVSARAGVPGVVSPAEGGR